jgi:hypothetical protein
MSFDKFSPGGTAALWHAAEQLAYRRNRLAPMRRAIAISARKTPEEQNQRRWVIWQCE